MWVKSNESAFLKVFVFLLNVCGGAFTETYGVYEAASNGVRRILALVNLCSQ
ncbi:hypothetical protein TERTU_0013 [Teredinibacter turnerae T7901]|uniref:Uncharacterized protein n=1 Tax=Teredinibacter turnerae (strain ATCC 39867 / T7901) TaxID=377629 RepID=C5BKM8_TERTT|nr:hypothetical protein TERTU_0013 [Teredinibacter turnerae T7901]